VVVWVVWVVGEVSGAGEAGEAGEVGAVVGVVEGRLPLPETDCAQPDAAVSIAATRRAAVRDLMPSITGCVPSSRTPEGRHPRSAALGDPASGVAVSPRSVRPG
jgi:hypothetical protein